LRWGVSVSSALWRYTNAVIIIIIIIIITTNEECGIRRGRY